MGPHHIRALSGLCLNCDSSLQSSLPWDLWWKKKFRKNSVDSLCLGVSEVSFLNVCAVSPGKQKSLEGLPLIIFYLF